MVRQENKPGMARASSIITAIIKVHPAKKLLSDRCSRHPHTAAHAWHRRDPAKCARLEPICPQSPESSLSHQHSPRGADETPLVQPIVVKILAKSLGKATCFSRVHPANVFGAVPELGRNLLECAIVRPGTGASQSSSKQHGDDYESAGEQSTPERAPDIVLCLPNTHPDPEL